MYSTGIGKYHRRSNQCELTDKQVLNLIIKYDLYARHDEEAGPRTLEQLRSAARERGLEAEDLESLAHFCGQR